MSAHEVLTRDDDIDVIGLFAALKRKWWLIMLVTIIAAVGLFMSLSAVSPRYLSEARIAILNNESSFTRSIRDTGQQFNNERLGEQAVLTQVEIISSDKAALRVIDDLELMKLKEFGGKGFFDRLIDGLLGKDPDNFDLDATTDEGEKRDIMKRRDSALSKFKDKLDVYAVEKTTIIVIEFWSHDPDLAQKIVKGLSENYIARQVDSKNQENLEAAGWLDPKIEEFEERIRLAETAVANFRADSDIFASNTASGENNGNGLLATQQLSEVSTELSRLKAARSSAQAKVASIRAALDSGASLDVIPEVIDSRLIQNLREREATLRAQISDLNTTLLPNHPRMQALNSQLEDL
ncbi:MAG: GumC family protein, partial [Pseudomonadota bacterium]